MPDNAASLEAILAEIRQQSAVEVEAVRQAAAKEQAQIEQRAKLEAGKIRADILKKAQIKAEQIRKRTAAVSNLELKKINLQSRSLIIAEIRRRLNERLLEIRQSDEYVKLLQHLLTEGILGLGVTAIQISAGDRERTLLTADLLETAVAATNPAVHLTLNDELLPEAGIILYSADRRRRFDNRLTRFSERLFEQYQWTLMQKFTQNEPKR